MDHFQDLISALVHDVKKIEQNNKMLEQRYEKERDSHSAYLERIGAELDAQMAKVEQQALAKAKHEHDNEKRVLQTKMEAELTELQTQLKLFQKVWLFEKKGRDSNPIIFVMQVDTWLNKEKNETSHTEEAQKKLDQAADENRSLKCVLTDTQTNIALLRAELGQIRHQYENKCSELSE